jgi:hypothetical protein
MLNIFIYVLWFFATPYIHIHTVHICYFTIWIVDIFSMDTVTCAVHTEVHFENNP